MPVSGQKQHVLSRLHGNMEILVRTLNMTLQKITRRFLKHGFVSSKISWPGHV